MTFICMTLTGAQSEIAQLAILTCDSYPVTFSELWPNNTIPFARFFLYQCDQNLKKKGQFDFYSEIEGIKKEIGLSFIM